MHKENILCRPTCSSTFFSFLLFFFFFNFLLAHRSTQINDAMATGSTCIDAFFFVLHAVHVHVSSI